MTARAVATLPTLSRADLLQVASTALTEIAGSKAAHPLTTALIDQILCRHVPEWAVADVLTSLDYSTLILSHLELRHARVAAVCKCWHQAWVGMLRGQLTLEKEIASWLARPMGLLRDTVGEHATGPSSVCMIGDSLLCASFPQYGATGSLTFYHIPEAHHVKLWIALNHPTNGWVHIMCASHDSVYYQEMESDTEPAKLIKLQLVHTANPDPIRETTQISRALSLSFNSLAHLEGRVYAAPCIETSGDELEDLRTVGTIHLFDARSLEPAGKLQLPPCLHEECIIAAGEGRLFVMPKHSPSSIHVLDTLGQPLWTIPTEASRMESAIKVEPFADVLFILSAGKFDDPLGFGDHSNYDPNFDTLTLLHVLPIDGRPARQHPVRLETHDNEDMADSYDMAIGDGHVLVADWAFGPIRRVPIAMPSDTDTRQGALYSYQ
jgi:hypothetical protein